MLTLRIVFPLDTDLTGTNPSTIFYPTYSQTFLYDRRGRVIETAEVLPDGTRHTQLQRYDAVGNRLSFTDAEERTTHYEYDALNRLIAEIDALGVRTEMSYDSRDNLLNVTTGANDGLTRFTYDLKDRQVSETQPLGEQSTSVYDGEDNLIEAIARDGQRTVYSYDADNRLTLEQHAPADSPEVVVRTTQYSFSVLDQLTGYNDGTTSAVYTHDLYGRKVTESTNYGAFEATVGYDYYANNQLKSVTDPTGVTYTYAYDAAGQWAATELPGTGVITVNTRSWTAPTRITYPGGTVRNMSYTPRQYLDTLQVQSPTGEMRLDYDYSHTPTGNIDSINTEYGLKQYGYDAVDRLISAVNPTLENETYSYDNRGNRLTDSTEPGSWIYSENNELESAGNTVFNYDTNGSQITKQTDEDIINYKYNEAGRLSRVTDSDGISIGSYQYDPFGRRLWKEVNDTRTYFIYNDQGLIGEADNIGTIQRVYGYQPDKTWMTDPLFLRAETGQYLYYQNDHLGTPQQLLTVAGTTAWAQQSSAFGERKVLVEKVEDMLGFSGQYNDIETGLGYNYFRDYSFSTGRYIQSDPVGLSGGLNIYSYVFNDPLLYHDPTGEFGLLGAGVFGGMDLYFQLAANGGDWSCIDLSQIAVSAGLGAVGGGLASGFSRGAFTVRVARSRGGNPPSYTWGATVQWGARNNIRALQISPGQQRHHWLFQQNQGWGRNVPNYIRNQPWNINPVSASFNNWMSRGNTNFRSLLGAPPWARGVVGGGVLASGGAVANAFGTGDNCGC